MPTEDHHLNKLIELTVPILHTFYQDLKRFLKFFLPFIGYEAFLIMYSGPYEGQSKITEPYLIAFESSKMDIY